MKNQDRDVLFAFPRDKENGYRVSKRAHGDESECIWEFTRTAKARNVC
jgi:hypothetical protein